VSRLPALFVAAVLLAGCGSTVETSGRTSLGNDPLGGPAPSMAAASANPAFGVPAPPGGPAGAAPGSTLPAAAATTSRNGTHAPTGASRITAPIELGFMTTNVGNAQSAGLNVGQTYSDKQLYAALVKEYNARGGLAGRKILPVYGDTDTASSDWNTQFQAACQALTQDHHVQAVLGYVFVFLDSFEQCLAGKGIPHLYGGYQPGDVQAQRDFPSIVSVAHPSVNLVNETVLAGAMASGRLTTRSKLGIVYDGCAHGDRAFKSSTAPYLKQHGIPFETVYLDCAGGSGDVGAAAATMKSAQLQFAAHGVDIVMCTNGIELLLFMENAESQGYRPAYLAPGGGGALEAQGGTVPQAQIKNLHGFGWMPAIDVGASHQPYAHTPEQVACLTKLKHQGLVPAAYNDFMFAYVTCDALDLYARVLTLTGGSSGAADVKKTLLQVMPGFHGAATYDGAFAVTPMQRGGPGRYREIGWTDGCSCFTYRGPVRAVPTS
jgi:hypothetical protein